jgi:ATP-binding cassette subfamily B protein RaxB
MLGLLKPTSGEVRYNGQNIYKAGLRHYRHNVAAVLQGEHLLNGNVLENITMFAEQPSLVKCSRVLEQADMLQVIQSLPLGFYTLVGELGNIFSGGQIQRLLLARALYNEPKILFLDEATSHLDSRTEKQISTVIANLALTRICIAHRSETIAQFTTKLCLKDGNLSYMS